MTCNKRNLYISLLYHRNYCRSMVKVPGNICTILQLQIKVGGASLVAQWLRIHLPMQETWVRALVREDPACHGATKPVHHNY